MPPASNNCALLNLPKHILGRVFDHLCSNMSRDCPFLLNRLPLEEELLVFDEDGTVRSEAEEHWDPDTFWDEYRFGGLETPCPNETSEGSPCGCPPILLGGLMRCCRTFYSETSARFYSRNSFIVHRCAHEGMLGALKKIPTANLGVLSSLQVHVNTSLPGGRRQWFWDDVNLIDTERPEFCKCYCNDPVPTDFPWPYEYCVCDRLDRPFSTVSRGAGRRALKELKKVVELLKSTVKPDHLELGIICDCRNYETAKAFVSVLDGLPILRNCSIRLSPTYDESIQHVASQAVARLTGRDRLLDLSRFLKLPRELRIRILELTDLIAPTDIEYHTTWPYRGFRLQLEYFQRHHICKGVTGWDLTKTSSATSCRCWRFPSDLFLVNREFHKEATRIFFSKNHFIILPFNGRHRDQSHQTDEMYTPGDPKFIGRMSPSARRWIRSIQWAFPNDAGYMIRGPRGYGAIDDDNYATYLFWEHPEELRSWREELQLSHAEAVWKQELSSLFQAVPPGSLSLSLDFRSLGALHITRAYGSQKTPDFLDTCRQIVDTVSLVSSSTSQRLSKFFIYLPESLDEEHAQKLEWKMMGAHYDSVAKGKFIHRNRFEFWVRYLETKDGEQD